MERSAASPSGTAPGTALSADLPERLEIEMRRRTADGDDRVLKLTPAGARYGLSHGKARIALRYRLGEGALDSVWATLRQEGCDGLETVPHAGPPVVGGTSLRISTGPETYTATAMGKQAPAADDAETYERCLAAVEELLPAGRGDVVVHVQWDASMQGHAAGLDVDAGTDLVGLHRVPVDRAPAAPDTAGPPTTPIPSPMMMDAFEQHFARPRAVQLQLRQGSSPGAEAARSTTLTVEAGRERGVEVAFDAALGQVVLRPLPAAAAEPGTP